MTQVFVSYAKENFDKAHSIYQELEKAGVQSWMDKERLRPGNDFPVEITRAIRKCKTFMILLSNDCNSSDFVSIEIAIAQHFKKEIIPVLLEKCEQAEHLLPYVVRFHYWDLTEKEMTISGLANYVVSKFPPDNALAESIPELQDKQTELASEESPVKLVTNADYFKFTEQSGIKWPPHWNVSGRPFPETQAGDPVVQVSWDNAIAYCDHFGGRLPYVTDQFIIENKHKSNSRETPDITQWIDAGTEQEKQIWDIFNSQLVGINKRTAKLSHVGFQCLPADPILPSEFVHIDASDYLLGTDINKLQLLAQMYAVPFFKIRPMINRPICRYKMTSYKISSRCVTNMDYYTFIHETGGQWPIHWQSTWLKTHGYPFPCRLASLPVVNITWSNAKAYCRWSGTRLPDWRQWELAASGSERRLYPWGSEYKPGYCNSIESERGSLVSADEYPSGNTPDGVQQLSGNIWEMVSGPDGEIELRGGSYRVACELWGLTFAFRKSFRENDYAPDVGFRVIC